MNTSAINSGAMFVHYNHDKLKDAVFEGANLVGTFFIKSKGRNGNQLD